VHVEVYPSTKIVALVIPRERFIARIVRDGEKKSCTLPYMLRVNAVQLSTYEIQVLFSAPRWYNMEEIRSKPTRMEIS
jgi:hypothetical protein